MPALDVDTLLAGGRCRWDGWMNILGATSEEDVEKTCDAREAVELVVGGQDKEVYGEMQRREDLEELGMDVAMQEGANDDPRLGIVGDEEMRSKVSPSVYGDGKGHPRGTREGTSEEDMAFRLPMANSSGNRGRVEHPRITQLPSDTPEGHKGQETPVVKVQPPSSYASPGSLYDENGFLRC